MRLILILAAAILCSCVTVNTNVTRFHTLPPKGNGETFYVEAPPHVGPLESASHAAQISAGFQQYGWRPSGTESDYKVMFDYSIGEGQTTSGVVPIIGQTGGGTTFHTGTFNSYGSGGSSFGSVSGTSYSAPTYGTVGAIPYTTTTYTRNLAMVVINKSGQNVLEAKAKSVGTIGDINGVLPIMIKSVFSEFPGVSGKTKMYSKPLR
ncbi:DUF4136 domain-containing protein [Prosthecobacter sp. SYSU 5D2]|uniref:DUF4136 domain-containing protein n=1 Tax=Prosthecobacter sp. SYSU 5D2 TaxID=3134134 RepID=UPI0031FF165D